MKVLKFGGTSVGTVESLRNVKKIIENNKPEPLIVVVSALGGITDSLIRMARTAANGDNAYVADFQKIVDRHNEIIDMLVAPEECPDVKNQIGELLDKLFDILRGLSLIKDLSQRVLDLVESYGERLSSLLITNLIPGSKLFDSRTFIKTETSWGDKHTFDLEASKALIHETFDRYVNKKGFIGIVPGFIASDAANGYVTNLGRGGSDYTAAILAANLGASVLEIWTDVDGFMTADPKSINTSYPIERLSFVEAMELCNFGAKVIYPPTIYPVFLANIPVYIKNTFNPESKGTLIGDIHDNENKHDERLIKGISSINDTALISISGLGMVGIVGINARIFSALANKGISVFMVSQASSENNTSLAVKEVDAARAVDVLSEEFRNELLSGQISEVKARKGLSTVAIVGANMKGVPGVAGRLFNTLGRNGINVVACAQGSNETNISFVVKTADLPKTLNVIHDSFFLSSTQILNLFIVGIGKVGSRLLHQIKSQQEKLLKEKALEIKVVGISNSKKAIFDRNGIDLDDYQKLLETQGIESSPEVIEKEVIGMNIFNPVFVDCTSNADIASLYKSLLSHNVNVVAANKFAASGPYDTYRQLKDIARRKDVKFLFETNVGAGLPIISTMNSLINSGDNILKIEAVVSGTLNFIFNEIGNDVKLSEAIVLSREKGFSEPDPRIDLSGDDVVKKIVILAREAGYEIEQKDVVREPLLPHECFEGSMEDFLEKVRKIDNEFEDKRKEFEEEGRRVRFIASYQNGIASVGLCEIDPSHPFYNIESNNNVIALTTDRYHEYPIVIKGYGAGAEVTAAGVFADIISIANIR